MPLRLGRSLYWSKNYYSVNYGSMLNKSVSIDKTLQTRRFVKKRLSGKLTASFSHNLLFGSFRLVNKPTINKFSKRNRFKIQGVKENKVNATKRFCVRHLIRRDNKSYVKPVLKKESRFRDLEEVTDKITEYRDSMSVVDRYLQGLVVQSNADNTVAIRQAIELLVFNRRG